ncbi:MAG: sensor histidine kinase [Muribaculaceae bacterium]
MKQISLYIDLAFCLVILPLLIYLFPVERWWGEHPLYFGLFVAWLYVSYFLYKYHIIPSLFHRGRRRILGIASLIFSLAVTFSFSAHQISSPYYKLRQQYGISEKHRWGARQNQQAVWLHFIIVATFCVAEGMLTEVFRLRMAKGKIEYERNKAELALFKAQIDPHFLFNTLNTIYGLLITTSDKAEMAMERFITLTKYVYINAKKDTIPLEEELDYISQYIELQKLRTAENCTVTFSFDIDDGSFPIPPMLLITFVENAFKHGILSTEKCFIRISAVAHNNHLTFTTLNSCTTNRHSNSTGTGIENCKRRLEILYPDAYSLKYGENNDDTYSVTLKLKL